MKKKLILKRIFHRDKWRYAIIFDKDSMLISLARKIPGATWSQTNGCWYADSDEATLKKIITTFRESADIDISAIVSGSEEHEFQVDDDIKNEEEPDNNVPDEFIYDSPAPVAIRTLKADPDKVKEFGPVKFSLIEQEGKLVIKFLGRYDEDWLNELRSYRKGYFDEDRKEWIIKWSQLTVDSLSDYFSSRGVTVIIVKSLISPVIKNMRNKKGSEVRSRTLNEDALSGIDLVREYLEEKRYSARTINAYTTHLELFFKYFSDRDPAKIKEKDISEFINDFIIGLRYSSSYQNIIISAIKMFYSLSGPRRLTLESIERPRRSRALPKVFSKEEVMQIFSATRNGKHKLILWLVYSCGLRRSEVTKIKLKDLDPDRGILHIREGKGNVDRQVPVPQKVWEKIRVYKEAYKPETYLFEGRPGNRYSVESVYSVFKQSLKQAGIQKDVGIHSLRHSYATHLHENGLDIRYIQELLGHKSTRTTEIYTHVSRRNLFAIRSPIEDMEID